MPLPTLADMQRRLSLTSGTSDKFWHLDVDGCTVTVRYGRRGTRGQTSTKSHPDAGTALREAQRQVAAKLAKGYRDDDAPSGEPAAPVTTDAAPPDTTAVPAADAAPADTTAVPASDPAAPPADTLAAPAPPAPPAAAADPGDPYDIGLAPLGPFDEALRVEAAVRADLDTSPFDEDAARRARRRVRAVPRWLATDLYATPTPLDAVPTGAALQWWRAEAVRLGAGPVPVPGPGARRDPIDAAQPGLAVVLHVCHLGVDDYVRSLSLRPPLQVLAARSILPLAAPDAVDDLRRQVSDPDADPDAAVFVRAILGDGEDAAERVRTDRRPRWNRPDEEVYLLRTPQERGAFADETEMTLRASDTMLVFPWLVATGSAGFPTLVRSVTAMSATDAKSFLNELARCLDGVGSVPLFADLLATKGTPGALDWLGDHVPQVLAAHLTAEQAERLAPVLHGYDDATLRAACDNPDLAATARAILDERAAPTFDPGTGWWAEADAADQSALVALPKEIAVGSVAALRVDETRLGPHETARLLGALQHAPDTSPLVTAVRDHVGEQARDDFAVALLDRWLSVNGPAKHSWMMIGAARIGGRRTVSRIAALVRRWPLESQHQRARNGLAALAAAGSDLAIAELADIAARIRFAALRTAAQEQMARVAEGRGLTRGELEDRIVPRGGLDDDGSCTFDMGSRQFRGVLGADGRLALRLLEDGRPTGTPRTTLPAPVKADDPQLAAAAKADLAATKKALATIVKTQVSRYEAAMISGRRWSPADHRTFVADHPVLRRLLAGVVWGLYDGDTLAGTARVDEDGVLVDEHDDPVDPGDRLLGVAHPVDLTPDEREAWAAVMSDYELVAAFPQLTRPVPELTAEQLDAVALPGLPTAAVPATTVVRAFTRYGWERGLPEDGGAVYAYSLAHEASGLTVAMYLSEGIAVGFSPAEQGDQAIEAVDLVEGLHPGSRFGYRWHTPDDDLLPWSRAPRALVSEVLATLHEMGLR